MFDLALTVVMSVYLAFICACIYGLWTFRPGGRGSLWLRKVVRRAFGVEEE